MFTATFPSPTSLSTQFILQRSWEESAVICCNPQRAPHTRPRFKPPHTCMRMHTRWPWCLVNWGTAEIWLCWISKWTLIEFPTVSSCDTACPNAVHLEWKGMVMHGKHYFKGHCCCFGWISMLLSDWDTIQHHCMGLILEQRLQPQARFDPLVQAEGHLQDVSEAELHLLFSYLVLHWKKVMHIIYMILGWFITFLKPWILFQKISKVL